MSITATIEAWSTVDDADISPKAALVFVALAHFHNQETGRCDPSIRRIARRTKLARNTVKAAIAELRAEKLLRVTTRKVQGSGGKKNLPNRYVLLTKGGSATDPGVGQQLATKVEDLGAARKTSAFYDLANLIEVEE